MQLDIESIARHRNGIRRRLDNLLDELMDSDDPSFTTDQVDLLEKRFFEISQNQDESPEPETPATDTELLETLCDCVRVLADFDEQDGDEGATYRRCLALLARLSRKPIQATHAVHTKP